MTQQTMLIERACMLIVPRHINTSILHAADRHRAWACGEALHALAGLRCTLRTLHVLPHCRNTRTRRNTAPANSQVLSHDVSNSKNMQHACRAEHPRGSRAHRFVYALSRPRHKDQTKMHARTHSSTHLSRASAHWQY
jgi:hypothetical protein